MELYLLNNDLSPDLLIDGYESLVWTDRFSSEGDFILELPMSARWRNRLVPGRKLSYDASLRVMCIKTSEEVVDTQGQRKLRVTGPSLESIFAGRVAMHPTSPTWTLAFPPGQMVRRVVDDVCREGILDEKDKIPGLVLGTLFPPDTVPEPYEELELEIEAEQLDKFVKDVCDAYDLGYRLCRNPDTYELVFEVYTGRDLTTGALVDDPVVFSIDFGNMNQTSLVRSDEYYKSVAVVYSAQGRVWVTRGDGSENARGLKREVLLVKNTDITADWNSTRAQMQMRVDGQRALAASRRIVGFDGEISQVDSYDYGVHYHVGDIVELRSEDTEESRMRVTEQILVNDINGERSYPTLTYLNTSTEGTWLSKSGDQTWSEAGSTTWSEADTLGGV